MPADSLETVENSWGQTTPSSFATVTVVELAAKLGRWVVDQRAAKKRLDDGHPRPRITAERVAKLEVLGFKWAAAATGDCAAVHAANTDCLTNTWP